MHISFTVAAYTKFVLPNTILIILTLIYCLMDKSASRPINIEMSSQASLTGICLFRVPAPFVLTSYSIFSAALLLMQVLAHAALTI